MPMTLLIISSNSNEQENPFHVKKKQIEDDICVGYKYMPVVLLPDPDGPGHLAVQLSD